MVGLFTPGIELIIVSVVFILIVDDCLLHFSSLSDRTWKLRSHVNDQIVRCVQLRCVSQFVVRVMSMLIVSADMCVPIKVG